MVLDAYVQKRLSAAAKSKELFNATSISETELREKSLERYAAFLEAKLVWVSI